MQKNELFIQYTKKRIPTGEICEKCGKGFEKQDCSRKNARKNNTKNVEKDDKMKLYVFCILSNRQLERKNAGSTTNWLSNWTKSATIFL